MAQKKDAPKEGAEPEKEHTDKPFEEVLERLENIVADLERGDLRLEQSLDLFEEGVKLSRRAAATLDDAERRIEELLADGQKAPFRENQPKPGDQSM